MPRLGPLLGLLCVLALAPAASAADLPHTQAALARQLALAGPGSGAYVVDLTTGAELYAARPDAGRLPASVEKLYLTAAALLRYGPEGHLTTSALAVGPPDPTTGVLAGDLVLRGGGDPTFGPAAADAFAAALAGAGLTEVTGRVVGDESLFDGLRGPPSSGYRTSSDVGPLSALAFGEGRTGRRWPYFQASPARFAAQAFEKALERQGVTIAGHARAGVAPNGTVTVSQFDSPSIADIVRRMNVPSDNFIAETLIKALGAQFGAGGSTAAGAAVVRGSVAGLGVRPRIVDGSGLSRADLTTPRQVVQLLSAMSLGNLAQPFEDSLAVAGRTGTLRKRMRRTLARDRCRGKTGTLRDVSNLAGYCDTTGGEQVAFAILMNRVNPYGARRLQDRMTATLAAYDPGAFAAQAAR